MRSKTTLAALMSLVAGSTFAAKAVLLVDGREITDGRLETAKRIVAAQSRGREVPADELLRLAVDQVIGQALLAGAAREAGIEVKPAEVDAALEAQQRAAGGAPAFASRLQQAGLSEADVRAMEADRLTIQRFIQTTIVPTVQVGEAELKAYYDGHQDEFEHEAQIHVRQVLAAAPAGATAEQKAAARARAARARERLSAGEDFATVARELSDDPSKNKGGEVGWVRKGMLLPELEAAVFAVPDGGLSEVLESSYGYHVFRVGARRDAGVYPLDEIKPALRQMLTQRAAGNAVAKLVADRRKAASILALDPALEPVLAPADAAGHPQP